MKNLTVVPTTPPLEAAATAVPVSASEHQPPGLLFRLAAGAALLFVITILALIATLFADPAAPVNQWLNLWGSLLLILEVAAIFGFGLGAMFRDQHQQHAADDARR